MPGRGFDRFAAILKRGLDVARRQHREVRVSAGVKADIEAGGGEVGDLRGSETVVGPVGSGDVEQPVAEHLAVDIRHPLDVGAELTQVAPVGPGRRTGGHPLAQLIELDHPCLGGAHQTLPPKAVRTVEGGAADEERGRHLAAPEQRRGGVQMRWVVVVEGNRDRDPLPAPPRAGGLAKLCRGYQAVHPPELAQLDLELVAPERQVGLGLPPRRRARLEPVIHDGGGNATAPESGAEIQNWGPEHADQIGEAGPETWPVHLDRA